MKIGTKSLLFGCHQFILHPLFVLRAWWKLYGRPNWRELVCIIIHDLGYFGCSDMDGEEGSRHPVWAGKFMDKFMNWLTGDDHVGNKYAHLCWLHSRFLSSQIRLDPSRLCWADKLGTALMPAWLWVLLGRLSGEIDEYMSNPRGNALNWGTEPVEWFNHYKTFVFNNIPEIKATAK